ncbi:type II secretion system protein N [Agitococcus lubricus]|uniref:Type II secretion system protein C (GspC) n=1 Tax=Agitococcus lubricus TaxID=1077255 RepID=A0A2T5IV15_9GAMM|nr:type II secretion system protein N [Agitococcus lubricus]PTQ87713.1 type II secretion system protein C (GspC) [Agitococcus lubricus]
MKTPSLTSITQYNRQIARLIMLVATLYFAWRMSSLLWLLAGQDKMPLNPPAQSQQTSTSAMVDSSRLASFTLFKSAPIESSPNAAANAPETALQLKLDGVFVSVEKTRSSAIISEQGQTVGKLYKVGQQVAGGATLSAVFVDKVLLQRNGNDEVLRFVKTNLLGGDAPVTTPNAPANTGAQARQMLGQAINRLNTDPSGYLAEMGLLAKGQGYEISDNAPAHLRRSIGLRTGDKILKLNGQVLGNPQADKDLLQQVQQSGHARIEILRGSQTLTIEQTF